MERIQLPHNSWIDFYSDIPADLFPRIDSKEEFERLWNLHPAEKGIVNVFGEKETPRWQQSYGHDYQFSRIKHESLPIEDPFLIKILDCVRKHSGLPYNGILINWYADGNHYIGPHSDDESELVLGSPIYSFSFGQERDFRITSKPKNSSQIEPYTIKLPNNSLLIMCEDMQKYYKHSVPKRALSRCPEKRINVTVRHFKE